MNISIFAKVKNFLLWLTIACAANLSTGCGQDYVDFYSPTREALINANVNGQDRWIIQLLPINSTHIRERFNIETNERWMSFLFNPEDKNELANHCKESSTEDILLPYTERSKDIIWWPKDLMRTSKHVNQHYVFYKCTERAGAFLVRVKGGNEVFYWELGS